MARPRPTIPCHEAIWGLRRPEHLVNLNYSTVVHAVIEGKWVFSQHFLEPLLVRSLARYFEGMRWLAHRDLVLENLILLIGVDPV